LLVYLCLRTTAKAEFSVEVLANLCSNSERAGSNQFEIQLRELNTKYGKIEEISSCDTSTDLGIQVLVARVETIRRGKHFTETIIGMRHPVSIEVTDHKDNR
jgi:hypothetical protein